MFTQFQELQFQAGNYDRYQGNFDIGGPVVGTNNEWAYHLTGVFRDSHIPFIMGAKDDHLGHLSPRFRGARLQVNARNVFNRYYTTCIQSFCYRGAPAQVISSLIYRW